MAAVAASSGLEEGHWLCPIEDRGGWTRPARGSYSFDVIDDDREYSIHATGSEIGEPGLARRSLSFTNALQEDYSQATTLSFDNGSLEYTMDQDLSAHHSAARYANSTLSGTWSSFDSHVIYENETDDSASGYVVEDPQTGQVSYDYESNGTDSIDYHHYGGGSTLSIDIDDSFHDGDSTGGIPWAVTDQYDTNVTFQSEAHSTAGYTYSNALFGVPETDIDTVHLGTSMNLGGSGNLHDLIGSVTTRSLARDANALAAGADEIHPILELQNPYHFVLEDSMEGNGTWDASPGAWQYRRNWEVSQDEMLRSSGSNGEQAVFQSLEDEGGYGSPTNVPTPPGGSGTGLGVEKSQNLLHFLQIDEGAPSTGTLAKPSTNENRVARRRRCVICHSPTGLLGSGSFSSLSTADKIVAMQWLDVDNEREAMWRMTNLRSQASGGQRAIGAGLGYAGSGLLTATGIGSPAGAALAVWSTDQFGTAIGEFASGQPLNSMGSELIRIHLGEGVSAQFASVAYENGPDIIAVGSMGLRVGVRGVRSLGSLTGTRNAAPNSQLATVERSGLGVSHQALPRTPGIPDSAAMAEILENGWIPGRQGIVVTDRTVMFSDMFKASKASGVEFGLARETVGDSRVFKLYSGGGDYVRIPSGPGARNIGHTHPQGSRYPSTGDVSDMANINRAFLKALQQNPTAPLPHRRVIWGEGLNDSTIYYPDLVR